MIDPVFDSDMLTVMNRTVNDMFGSVSHLVSFLGRRATTHDSVDMRYIKFDFPANSNYTQLV